MKLPNLKRLPNQIKPNRTEFISSWVNHIEPHCWYFLCLPFYKIFGSVRSNRTSKWTEYDGFRWWIWWILFNWVQFDSKIRLKFGNFTVNGLELSLEPKIHTHKRVRNPPFMGFGFDFRIPNSKKNFFEFSHMNLTNIIYQKWFNIRFKFAMRMIRCSFY